MAKIRLGDRVKDEITGYCGIVVCISDYLYGCERSMLESECIKDDGTLHDDLWFDNARLIMLKKQVFSKRVAIQKIKQTNGTGGGSNPPSRRKLQ